MGDRAAAACWTNRLLRRLSPGAVDFLTHYAVTRPIAPGEVIYEDGALFTHAVFPEAGVISLMARRESGATSEKMSVGCEGFIGTAILVGKRQALSRSVTRIEGAATFVPMEILLEAARRYPCIDDTFRLYNQSVIVQLMETVTGARLDHADKQVVDWLLFARARLESDSFALTQDMLAEVLGLRRVTVGAVWSALRDAGLIAYTRGRLTITDLPGLAARASESHARIVAAFAWQDEPVERDRRASAPRS